MIFVYWKIDFQFCIMMISSNKNIHGMFITLNLIYSLNKTVISDIKKKEKPGLLLAGFFVHFTIKYDRIINKYT